MRVMFRDALSKNADVVSIGLDLNATIRVDDRSVHLTSSGVRIGLNSPETANDVAEDLGRLLASVNPPLLVEVHHDGRVEVGSDTGLDIRRACLVADFEVKREDDKRWRSLTDDNTALSRTVGELRAKLDDAISEVHGYALKEPT